MFVADRLPFPNEGDGMVFNATYTSIAQRPDRQILRINHVIAGTDVAHTRGGISRDGQSVVS